MIFDDNDEKNKNKTQSLTFQNIWKAESNPRLLQTSEMPRYSFGRIAPEVTSYRTHLKRRFINRRFPLHRLWMNEVLSKDGTSKRGVAHNETLFLWSCDSYFSYWIVMQGNLVCADKTFQLLASLFLTPCLNCGMKHSFPGELVYKEEARQFSELRLTPS